MGDWQNIQIKVLLSQNWGGDCSAHDRTVGGGGDCSVYSRTWWWGSSVAMKTHNNQLVMLTREMRELSALSLAYNRTRRGAPMLRWPGNDRCLLQVQHIFDHDQYI